MSDYQPFEQLAEDIDKWAEETNLKAYLEASKRFIERKEKLSKVKDDSVQG